MKEINFDYVKMMKEIDTYMNKYKFLSITMASKSMLGNNIPAIIFGEGKSTVVYVGGEEGCDAMSSNILLRFVKDICSLSEEGGSAFGFSAELIFKNYTIVIIPMLNPDGSCYCSQGLAIDNPLRERVLRINDGSEDFSAWKGNARGVELKYNYDTEYSQNEPEVEVGTLCNFLRYGFKPDILLSFSRSASNNEGIIGFGEGEIENKMAVALSQMSGMKRAYRESEMHRLTIVDWSIRELCAAAFSIELPHLKYSTQKQFNDKCFSHYAQLRKVLFCTPFLNKIK